MEWEIRCVIRDEVWNNNNCNNVEGIGQNGGHRSGRLCKRIKRLEVNRFRGMGGPRDEALRKGKTFFY